MPGIASGNDSNYSWWETKIDDCFGISEYIKSVTTSPVQKGLKNYDLLLVNNFPIDSVCNKCL